MTGGLKQEYCAALVDIFAAHPNLDGVVLFGSRATGTHSAESDVDLALFGQALSSAEHAQIAEAIDHLTIPQRVDLLIYDHIENDNLRAEIRKHGVVFFGRTPAFAAAWRAEKTAGTGDAGG